MKQPVHWTQIHPYEVTITLFTEEKAHVKYVQKAKGFEDVTEECGRQGIAYYLEDQHEVSIGVYTGKDYILLHEIVHAVTWTLNNAHVHVSHENTEVLAYHISWLYKELTEAYAKALAPKKKKNVRQVSKSRR